MTPAWQQREFERSELIKRLKAFLLDEQDETHKSLTLQVPFCNSLLKHLARSEGIDIAFDPASPSEVLLRDKILPAIKEFSRTPEEEASLLSDLLVWEVTSITRHFKHPLSCQEMIEPEKVFGGKQAMDRAD